MLKKLLTLLVLLIIMGSAYFCGSISTWLPWFATQGDESSTKVATSDPIKSAVSTLPHKKTPPEKPDDPKPSPTPGTWLNRLAPICFKPENNLNYFAFTSEADLLMLRASTGMQIIGLMAGLEVASVHAYQPTRKPGES